jgi:hypothetical protein
MFLYNVKETCLCYFLLHVPPTFHCSFTADIILAKVKLKFVCNLPNNQYCTHYFSDTRKTHLRQLSSKFSLVALSFHLYHDIMYQASMFILSRAYTMTRSRFYYCFCHNSLIIRSTVLLETLTACHQYS